MNNLKVNVVYRDKNLDPVYEKTYALRDYTDMIRMNIMRIITDVEDIVYTANGNLPKDDWSDKTFVAFQHIKHKLLDNAGAIGRLPDEISGGETNG